MRSLRRTLRRIGSDLLGFRNVEAYVVTLIGIALIVIDILGDVTTDVQLTVIIAALVVLVFRSTAPTTQKTGLDEVLGNRNNFGPFREFIRGGRTLWVYAPSAINILRDPSSIKEEILDRGGQLTVLLQNPNESTVIQNLENQLDIAAVDLKSDIQVSVEVLRKLKARHNNADYHIDYGFLTYSPGFSLTIVDAQRSTGRLVVEFFGFQNEFIGNRMHLEITRQQSEYWFEYWVDQFQEMASTAKMSPHA